MYSTIRNRFGRGIVFAGLSVALAFASASTFYLLKASTPKAKNTTSLAELDRKAQPFFNQAAANVADVAEKLSSMSSMAELCWLMGRDKMSGTHQVQEYLDSVLAEPIIAPCRKGAQVYGIDFKPAVFREELENIGANNVLASAYAVGGLALESLFLKSTITSLHKVLGATAAHMAFSLGGGSVCVAADGPFPFGDAVGLMLVFGCTVWNSYDLWQCRITLPAELAAALYRTIEHCRKLCRMEASL